MEMKHYKDAQNKTYGIREGQSVPAGLVEITKAECEMIGILNFQKQQEEEIANLDYVRQRLTEYPQVTDFLDAWVKNDQVALEEYRHKCLAVKSNFPNPPGF